MEIQRALKAGARGYLIKSAPPDELVRTIRHVAEGRRNREVAEKLFISEETVKVHVKHIMDKLGAAVPHSAARRRSATVTRHSHSGNSRSWRWRSPAC